MSDWFLEDAQGKFHKAIFTPLTKTVALGMKWEQQIHWTQELTAKDGRQVYVLKDAATNTIQGGISISEGEDHVFVHLIESATHITLNDFKHSHFVVGI